MKKLVSLFLALAMMLSMSAAVAEVTAAGVYPITTEKETLTIAMPISAKVEDINTNKLTLFLEEKMNIDLVFVELNTADTATQVNMLMTSGDLPDIVMGYNFPYDVLCGYADAGLVLPLDELIETYGSEGGWERFLAACPVANPEAYATYDGHLYAMPTSDISTNNQYGGYAPRIQTAFLEKLGMEMPTTLDEFYNFLVAVRDNDVNGNGDATDEIPLTSSTHGNFHLCVIRNIGNAFQYTEPNNYLNVKDGVVSFVGSNDLYKETVLYLKKLVDENLLDPAAFTQDAATLASRQVEEPYTVGALAVGYYTANVMDNSTEAFADFTVMPALEGPYGYKATSFMPANVSRPSVITSACKNPELAIRFLEYMYTEEASVIFRWGFEGVDWTQAPEGALGRGGIQAKYMLLKPQEWIQPTTNVIWNNVSFTFCDSGEYMYDGPDSTTGGLVASILAAGLKETVKREYLPNLLIGVEDALEYNELKALITDYVSSNTLLFALGDRSMDEWDDYCAELDNMGLARYVELTQTYYDKMFK